jgi:hypothetical protein
MSGILLPRTLAAAPMDAWAYEAPPQSSGKVLGALPPPGTLGAPSPAQQARERTKMRPISPDFITLYGALFSSRPTPLKHGRPRGEAARSQAQHEAEHPKHDGDCRSAPSSSRNLPLLHDPGGPSHLAHLARCLSPVARAGGADGLDPRLDPGDDAGDGGLKKKRREMVKDNNSLDIDANAK